MSVEIDCSGTRIKVQSPYNPEFVQGAKLLGGKWERPYWTFDRRDEDRVRDLCVRIYGEGAATATGFTAPVARCTLRVILLAAGSSAWSGYARTTSLVVAGRPVARVFGRDSGCKLSEGVIVDSGSIGSGGSRKNPGIIWDAGTVLIVRDVPLDTQHKVEALGDAELHDIEATIEVLP